MRQEPRDEEYAIDGGRRVVRGLGRGKYQVAGRHGVLVSVVLRGRYSDYGRVFCGTSRTSRGVNITAICEVVGTLRRVKTVGEGGVCGISYTRSYPRSKKYVVVLSSSAVFGLARAK